MELLPTIWAGTLAVILSVVVLALLSAYFTAPAGRARTVVMAATILLGVVTITAGVDSIAVHGERSMLVFTAVGVGIVAILLVIGKAIKGRN